MKADFMCLQETHRETTGPSIPGMHIAVNFKSNIYGSTILLCDKRLVETAAAKHHGTIELIMVELNQIVVVSVYKIPGEQFGWPTKFPLPEKLSCQRRRQSHHHLGRPQQCGRI